MAASGLLEFRHQRCVEARRVFHLWSMTHALELDEPGARNHLRDLLAQHFVLTDSGLDLRRRDVAADGRCIRIADHQHGRHLQLCKLVEHRLGEVSGNVGMNDGAYPYGAGRATCSGYSWPFCGCW